MVVPGRTLGWGDEGMETALLEHGNLKQGFIMTPGPCEIAVGATVVVFGWCVLAVQGTQKRSFWGWDLVEGIRD